MDSGERLARCQLIERGLAEAKKQLAQFEQVTNQVEASIKLLFQQSPDRAFNILYHYVLPLLAAIKRFFDQLQNGYVATVDANFVLPTKYSSLDAQRLFYYEEANEQMKRTLKTHITIEPFRVTIEEISKWFGDLKVRTLLTAVFFHCLTWIRLHFVVRKKIESTTKK